MSRIDSLIFFSVFLPVSSRARISAALQFGFRKSTLKLTPWFNAGFQPAGVKPPCVARIPPCAIPSEDTSSCAVFIQSTQSCLIACDDPIDNPKGDELSVTRLVCRAEICNDRCCESRSTDPDRKRPADCFYPILVPRQGPGHDQSESKEQDNWLAARKKTRAQRAQRSPRAEITQPPPLTLAFRQLNPIGPILETIRVECEIDYAIMAAPVFLCPAAGAGGQV